MLDDGIFANCSMNSVGNLTSYLIQISLARSTFRASAKKLAALLCCLLFIKTSAQRSKTLGSVPSLTLSAISSSASVELADRQSSRALFILPAR